MTNARLVVSGYGQLAVDVTRIHHGMSVLGSEDAARNDRVFNVTKVDDSRFGITVSCVSDQHRAAISNWLVGYAARASTPGSGVESMRVTVPSYGFDRVAVLARGIAFGAEVTRLTYDLALDFVAGRSQRDFENPIVSRYVGPSAADATSRYFYPSGIQLGDPTTPAARRQVLNGIRMP